MIRWILLLVLFAVLPVTAQDTESDESDAAAAEAETADSADAAEEAPVDDFELEIGVDHTQDNEDDFESSVDVLYQQSIPYPTDI